MRSTIRATRLILPTFEQFTRTLQRTCQRRAMSLEQYAAAHGLKLPGDHVLADVIGGLVMSSGMTRASKGKLRGKINQLAEYRRIVARYEMDVPLVEYKVPLNFSNEADCAYARAQYRRLLRKFGGERIVNV